MSELYPEPPHLSAFVLPELDEKLAILAAWDVLAAQGCEFVGEILVAREHDWFRYITDVEREVLRLVGPPHELLANHLVLRARFRHPRFGVVSLGLVPAVEFGDAHPLEVAIHAGPLALPGEIWSQTDRRNARRVLAWTEGLLVALAARTDAKYGAIGIESRFPTPAMLASTQADPLRPTTWFWSTRVSAHASAEETALLSTLTMDALSRYPDGTLIRAWRPWVDPVADLASLDRVVGFLGRALAANQ